MFFGAFLFRSPGSSLFGVRFVYKIAVDVGSWKRERERESQVVNIAYTHKYTHGDTHIER